MKYIIEFESQALNDIDHIGEYIELNLNAPQAARNLYNGIIREIDKLEYFAHSFAASTSKTVLLYGENAKRINYRHYAIIYTIEVPYVIIHRIIHGSLIVD